MCVPPAALTGSVHDERRGAGGQRAAAAAARPGAAAAPRAAARHQSQRERELVAEAVVAVDHITLRLT